MAINKFNGRHADLLPVARTPCLGDGVGDRSRGARRCGRFGHCDAPATLPGGRTAAETRLGACPSIREDGADPPGFRLVRAELRCGPSGAQSQRFGTAVEVTPRSGGRTHVPRPAIAYDSRRTSGTVCYAFRGPSLLHTLWSRRHEPCQRLIAHPRNPRPAPS